MVRLFKLFSIMPLALLRALGSFLGILVWLSAERSRTAIRDNLDRAKGSVGSNGGHLPNGIQLSAVLRSGWLVTELPIIWARPEKWEGLKIEGLDTIASLLSRGRGLIILTPHMGAFELAPRLFARHHPITVMYRPARHQLMEKTLQTFRPSNRIHMVPANSSGIRHFLRTLRSGGIVGLLPDQVPSLGEGVWAPFFGEPAYTMTLPIRLAQMTNAPIAWAVVERIGGGWTMSMYEWAVEMDFMRLHSHEDWLAAARLMNREIEALVLRSPRDYLWAYERYRHPRPAETRHGR